MTTDSNSRPGWSLPVKLALGVLAIETVVICGSASVWFYGWWQMGAVTFREQALMLVVQSLLMPWLVSISLLVPLAWALVRHHVDRPGAKPLRPARLFWTTLSLLLVLALAQHGALTFYYQPIFSATESWVAQLGYYRFAVNIGLTTLVLRALNVLVSVLVLLVAVRVGLRVARGERASTLAAPPGRHVVPVACALFLVGIQWNLQRLFSGWMTEVQHQYPLAMAVGTLVGGLLLFVLAFTGASFGAGRPAQVRPLRALAVAGLTLVVQFSACLVVGVLWASLFLRDLDPYGNPVEQLASTVLFVIAFYMVSLVLLMRWFTAMLYERHQVPAAADGEEAGPVSVP